MATAAISAVFERGAKAPWPVAAMQRSAGLRMVRNEPRKQEVRSVTRMSPEEPDGRLQAGVEASVRVTESPERAAQLAEQKVLADLAARCLAGDGEAWEQLARTQHRRIYGICYRFTGSQSDAEDQTQEVFLKMYKNLSSFDPSKGGFTTWLTTLTRNLLVDNYRRSRLERASDSLDETVGGEDDGPSKAERLVDGGRSQEQHVAGLELKAQIQAALAQVSPDLREAVILRDLEDMDYKDIAEILGVPQGTVKSRISRGRSELARLLKRIEGQVM
jgi:RNA polymerase sigma-70 factor (ECF subfamily)